MKVPSFTPSQQEWIEWALDGMDDPENYPDGPPSIEEALLDSETTADLLDKLEVIAEDMWEDRQPDQMGKGSPSIQSARNAAAKIRSATQ